MDLRPWHFSTNWYKRTDFDFNFNHFEKFFFIVNNFFFNLEERKHEWEMNKYFISYVFLVLIGCLLLENQQVKAQADQHHDDFSSL